MEALEAACTGTPVRKLDFRPQEAESWLNLSRDGNWNRLHTCARAATAPQFVKTRYSCSFVRSFTILLKRQRVLLCLCLALLAVLAARQRRESPSQGTRPCGPRGRPCPP